MSSNSDFTILMVEDDVYVRDLYAGRLIKDGFNVVQATNGADGLKKALEIEYDILLLDIMMPEMTGLEVLRKIKETPARKDRPVFLMTNLGQEGIIREAFKLGVNGYFLKTSKLPKEVSADLQNFLQSGNVPADTKHV